MPLSEHATRKRLIDAALLDAGWTSIARFDPLVPRELVALEEYPTAHGPADYVLFHNYEPLAVVEAKKQAVGPQNVLQQAQRYARGFTDSPWTFGDYRVPFIYSTNGDEIWFQDLRDPHSRSRRVHKFHTPAALRELLTRDLQGPKAWLRNRPVDHPGLRPYQREAIMAVEQAVLRDRRQMLIAMATGTGKTLTTIALLYRLMKAGYARRILFLVDRRALAAQAVDAFARFEGEPGLKFDKIYEVYSQRFRRDDLEDVTYDPKVLPTSYLTDPTDRHAFVYVCTIQRMQINLFGRESVGFSARADEDDAAQLEIPIHAFDVIVADECHRGYSASESGKWREVLEHFDGVKIGLTATPAAHTVAYFGETAYQYGYERAVREGYLVDYDPIVIQSHVTLKGTFLHPGEEVTLQDRETGQLRYEELEDERELAPTEIDTDWAAPDRDRKIVAEVSDYLRKQEQERGHFPKTLIFAHNDLPHVSHADRLVNLLRDAWGRGDAFVQKITGAPNVDRPLQRIREFRNRSEPGIVVTVDMLSTGVDIPELETIVLLRPVKSRILFEQILGRGTRRAPAIYKTHFTVFDAVGALDYFAKVTSFTADAPAKPTRPVEAIIDDIYNNRDRDYNTRVLVRRLQRIAKEISGEGRELFKQWIPDGDIAAWTEQLPAALNKQWAATMRVLRDKDFQRLLTSYPRARSMFLITEGTEDYVTSGYMIRTADGRAVRPEDYLKAFEQFVRDNQDRITAIRILLTRPQEWQTDVLHDLREKMAQQPDGFTVDRLRQAYHRELADIISLVKHAANGTPLLDAADRVDRALAQVRAGRTFTPEQERWLQLIRDHLIENSAIDRKDFELMTFTRAGATLNRVNRDFDGRLDNLLAQINAAMAA